VTAREVSAGHDLVVGGTGMLAGLCASLVAAGRTVSVIGRDGARLDALAATAGIRPLAVDYRDRDALLPALTAATEASGPIERAICWIHHGTAPDAAVQIARQTGRLFCHILGSAAGDPARPQLVAGWRNRVLQARPGLTYRTVILGFVPGGAGRASRWLSHDEIGNGVLAALQAGAPVSVVGTVEPWSARP
jgi:hypothetical protein